MIVHRHLMEHAAGSMFWDFCNQTDLNSKAVLLELFGFYSTTFRNTIFSKCAKWQFEYFEYSGSKILINEIHLFTRNGHLCQYYDEI